MTREARGTREDIAKAMELAPRYRSELLPPAAVARDNDPSGTT